MTDVKKQARFLAIGIIVALMYLLICIPLGGYLLLNHTNRVKDKIYKDFRMYNQLVEKQRKKWKIDVGKTGFGNEVEFNYDELITCADYLGKDREATILRAAIGQKLIKSKADGR